ncbi:AgmX/PglI C-terminal domain-containing protein [bacterium]|nr:AgmX/PglI C-terminal domain-containing protein [bacterium]
MKKLLVVVIIVVIVALLAAYKCSRSRGSENVETSPETSQPAPAPVAEPAPAVEEVPKAEEPAPAEAVKEEAAPEQKAEPAPAPAPAKKEKQEARPAPEKAEKAEKTEKPAEKPAPAAAPAEKKPIEREEKGVPERPTPSLREPDGANIDSAGVTKVINVSKAAIKRCYDKALTSNPMLKGKMSVKITINEQGRVSNTEVVDDSLKDAEVAKCVKGVIGRLRFPKPAGGSATVTFPFAFDPKNQ